MDRGKLLAIITGAISILIAIAYLIVVQLLDFRGEMIPAPPVSYWFHPMNDTILAAQTKSESRSSWHGIYSSLSNYTNCWNTQGSLISG